MPFSLKQARVTFTGKLASLSRKEAYEIVREAGGEIILGMTRQTSLLVVGMEGWPLLPDGMISSKLKRAEELTRRGFPVQIISEAVFLELAGRKERRTSLHKTHPAADVCKLLKISPGILRRWEQFGLVRSEAGSYDFQDLVSLRTLVELVNRGVKIATLAKSLKELASLLPGTDRPLAQLKIVADNPRAILADLGECLMAPDGQLTINFEAELKPSGTIIELNPGKKTEIEWFEQGQNCEEEERYLEAEDAYRRAITLEPQFPEAYFNLGNVVRALGRLEAAEELYHTAAAQDPAMAEAWYNLADVQEERGRLREAVSSLQAAIKACSSYADAHFNLALCYEKLGQKQDAASHWNTYLKLDPRSQWSEIARHHLSLAAR
jgi:tetratricopeptide (TPR) repeat protein